jgi:tetratricopeptide (TPR) repeat protein
MGAGTTALREPDLNMALKCIKQAVHLNPSSSAAQDALGRVYLALGDESSAIVCLEKAKQLNPADFHAPAELVKIYFRRKDTAKCLENIQLFDENVEKLNLNLLSPLARQWIGDAKRAHEEFRLRLQQKKDPQIKNLGDSL